MGFKLAAPMKWGFSLKGGLVPQFPEQVFNHVTPLCGTQDPYWRLLSECKLWLRHPAHYLPLITKYSKCEHDDIEPAVMQRVFCSLAALGAFERREL